MELTNGVKAMIRQSGISVKVEETDAAVTNLPGAVPLASFGERLGLFSDLEQLLPCKERNRGFSNLTSCVFRYRARSVSRAWISFVKTRASPACCVVR